MQQSSLNLIPSGDMPVVYASQYDKNRVIRFNLFDGDDEYTLTGTETVKCNIRKNDEHIVVIVPTIGNNTYIDVALTEQACACFGDNIGEITISDDADTLIGTINFILKVERNPIQGGVTSASDIADLETQIAEIVHEVMTDDYYTRDEVDAKLDLKANADDVYTKSEVDTALASKANTADVYTKTQVDTALGLKADKADTYTKTQVDTALALKADSSSVYTKAEVDTALAAKANAADVYTKTEVDEIIEGLYPVNIASGSIANFTTSLELPLDELKAEIIAQQAGTGTPSPQNERSISGFSSVGLTHTGKNIFSSSIVQGALYASGSESSTTTTRVKTDDYIICKSNTQYVVSFNSGIIPVSAVYYDKNKVYISGETLTGATFTTPLNCAYVRFGIAKTNTTQSITPSDVTQTQLEVGSTATAYEPYNAETKTIALPETIYGGVRDVKNGTATITHGMSIFDGSDENWGLASDGTVNRRFVLYGLPAFKNGSTSIANYLVYVTGTSHDFGTYSLGKSDQYGYYIVLHDESSNFASTDALKSYLEEHNLELVYELATPIEITGLTPANFTTFAGENNIFADCGDISVSFKQGIQEYIDSKVGG